MNIGEMKSAATQSEMRQVLDLLIPLAEAVIELHEFNERIGTWGMTPAQEMERVHLFDAYLKAVEKLVVE